MDIKARYLAYADAFEKTYVDGDWSRIIEYFTPDAVYEGEPEARGREAVLARLKNAIGTFDQRMDSRTPAFETPTVNGNTLTMHWTVTYTKAGLPPLAISGIETAVFNGDKIAILRDDLDPATQQAMKDWMSQHGVALNG
jgi:hypothetical protein